jgi:PAS domain S-box-containing protein
VVAQVGDVVYSVSAETDEFVCLSPSFERLLGWTLADVRRMGGRRAFLAEVIQDGRFAEQERLDREFKSSGGPRLPVRCEAWWRCKDGTLKYVEDNWEPVYQGDRLASSSGVLRDLTDRKRTEESLRESEARFLSAFDHAAIGMALVSPDGRWLKVNRAVCELTGYPEKEMLAKTFQDITHPDDLEKDLDYVRQMLDGRIRTYQMEKRYFHKEGRVLWVLLSVSLVRDAAGRPLYFISQIQDVSARKGAEAALRESEGRYRALVESSPEAITVLRGERFLYANPAALRLYGAKTFEELAAVKVADTCPPEELAEAAERGRRAKSGEKLRFREHQIVRLDGKRVTVESFGQAVNYQGAPAIQSLNRDITERKRAEAALRESEDRYRMLVESSPDAISVQKDGRILYANPATLRMYGARSFDELVAVPPMDLVPAADREVVRERYRQALAGEALPFRETRARRLDGAELPIEGIVRAVEFQGGKAALSIVRDISERKRAEARLREEEERAARYLDIAEVIVLALDGRGRITLVNRKGCEVLGYAEGELLGKDWFETCLPPEDRAKSAALYRDILAGEHAPYDYYESRVRTKGGEVRLVAWHTAILEDGRGGAVGSLSSGEDATERRQAERALADERERLAVTLRSIGDAVITTDREGRVVFLNRVAEDLTGWTQAEACGRPLSEVFRIVNEKTGEPAEDPVAKVLATGGIVGLANHTVLIARGGKRYVVEDSGAPIRDRDSRIVGVVLVFRDTTEKTRLREEMLRANRLDALGILAGGIAHDFNNILTVIMGNTSLAMMTNAANERLHKQLQETEKACLRAKDLTEQLLTFSKGGAPVRKTVSLAEVVRDSVDFALRGSAVRPRYDFTEGLWAASVDASQISRVFSNLAINGVQAMPGGGEVEVVARNVELAPGAAVPLPPGRYVEFAFRDQGIGIPPEHVGRVFDPFFTTKQQGSGLGLSICYSVVTRHEGHISVESEMGKGSVFRIFLPATGDRPRREGASRQAAAAFAGRILVMDDEESVRGVAAGMLAALGCEVECAPDGARAVELYRRAGERGRPFAAVLMDLTVPGGMGGREAARALLSLDPGARIIASSGYSTDPVMADPRAHGFRSTIAKPYTAAELSRVLAAVLPR